MAAVLGRTACAQLPEWDVRVEKIDPPSSSFVSALDNPSHVWNTAKLLWWRDRIFEAPDGARVLLIDGDTAIVRTLDPVWDLDFDLAYTVRPPGGYPFNGGVVFVRASPKTRAFFDAWYQVNLYLLGDADAHAPLRAKYAGMNQSSFGFILEGDAHGLDLVKLPCEEWNACAPHLYDVKVSRVIHIKSALRRAVFGVIPPRPNYLPMMRLWARLESGK